MTSGARYDRDWIYDERWSLVKHDEPKSMILTVAREYEAMVLAGMRDRVIFDPLICMVVEEVARDIDCVGRGQCSWCGQGLHPYDWHDDSMHWTCRVWTELRHRHFCDRTEGAASCESCQNPPTEERERARRHFSVARALCLSERKQAKDAQDAQDPARADLMRRRSTERIVRLVAAFRDEMWELVLATVTV